MTFQKLQALLSDVFNETIQSENELSFSSTTLVISCLFQIFSRAPKYALFKQRVSSFQDTAAKIEKNVCKIDSERHRSPSLLPSASEFALAGFFNFGYHDETVCAVCGLGLRDWKPIDKADESHIRFALSTAVEISESILRREDCADERISTAIPCLYIEVLRLLVSKFPLTRKNLVTESKYGSSEQCVDSLEYIENLAGRLIAIKDMMTSKSSLNWPVENASNLGYSDDIIALGLWRQQSESTSTPISFVTKDLMRLNPQDTALLLKSILRVQECGLDDADIELPSVENDFLAPITPSPEEQQPPQETVHGEESELETLLGQRVQRQPSLATLSSQTGSLNTKLPVLNEILFWWFERWSHKTPNPLK